MQEFLASLFGRVTGNKGLLGEAAAGAESVESLLDKAVEHLVDTISSRFRGISGYHGKLRQPVAAVLRYIDTMVEAVPAGFLCSRNTYLNDRRVNAFFVSPGHLSEIFSASKDIRRLFDEQPMADECWGLLCMRREEQQRFGMEMMGDTLVKDVRQRVVSFTDHQIVSPGLAEHDAKRALKCCIFNNLLEYSKKQLDQEKAGHLYHRTKQRGYSRHNGGKPAFHFKTLEDRFQIVIGILSNPEEFLQVRKLGMHIDRMGVIRDGSYSSGYHRPLELVEIDVIGRGSRVGALVGFRREELLPEQDLSRNADIFLAM